MIGFRLSKPILRHATQISECKGTTVCRPLFSLRERQTSPTTHTRSPPGTRIRKVSRHTRFNSERNSSKSSTWPSWPSESLYRFRVQYGGEVTTRCNDSLGMNDRSRASPCTKLCTFGTSSSVRGPVVTYFIALRFDLRMPTRAQLKNWQTSG